MEFNYELLITDICSLEQFWQDNKKVFRELENNFKDHYKAKYVSLLFDFYHELYEFSNLITDEFDVKDQECMWDLIDYFERFVVNYSKLIQFIEFTETECPYYIFSNFNRWKNKRLEMIESF